MIVDLLGYSERGMVNALCEDLVRTPALLPEFLSWFEFPGVSSALASITSATILVEQSFSGFGDLDLLVLLESAQAKPSAFLIEAKVSTDTSSWLTIDDRWEEFRSMLNGREASTSNLFVQLHRKVRLIEFLCGNRGTFAPDKLASGTIGDNQVVKKAAEKLAQHLRRDGNAFFGAIVPDDQDSLLTFMRDTVVGEWVRSSLETWNCQNWRFLSWQFICSKTTSGPWQRTRTSFEWNCGQIFRAGRPIQHRAQAGQVYYLNDQIVYVVSEGQHECRVAELALQDDRFFWATKRVDVQLLRECEGAIPPYTVPTLPRPKGVYVWDCSDGTPELPQAVSDPMERGTSVLVLRPSWYTTRVRKADPNADQGEFLVYTHHLRRE